MYSRNSIRISLNNTCNMAVCKAIDTKDTWFIANNLSEAYAIREYKKKI